LGCGGGLGSSGRINSHNLSEICQRSPRITNPTVAPFLRTVRRQDTIKSIYRDRLLDLTSAKLEFPEELPSR
jgi:hypothetical protein